MRKYFLSLVAMATMILFSGCNKNEDFYISENGDMVTFNIATPEMGTRAFSDGSTATNLIVAVYQGGQYREALTKNVTINGSAQVSLPLVTGVTYDIVFWAYATGAPYTFNPENGIVSVNYNGVTANNENLDAFYANKLGYTVQGPKTETIKLTRPFAQLNVATLDYEYAKNSGIDITQTAIEVDGVYTSFNLRNAEGAIDANTATTITLGLNNTPKAQSEVLSGYETYSWLSMNYLLVNEKTTVRAKMATNNGNVVREWSNIPVQRNYRTNILGNILTTTTDFNVVIDERFAGEEVYPDTDLENLYNAASNGGEVTLNGNVELTAPIIVKKNMIVNLNGKTITAALFAESNGSINEGDTDSYAFWVKSGANLTINGEGNILTQPCNYSIAVWAEGGNVTINGGHYENQGEGSDLIYASAAGNIIINGGTFKACEKQAGVSGTNELYSALNLKGDGTNPSIVVYGGSFYKFNPADNKSENPQVNFCAEGYTAHRHSDDYYYVLRTSSNGSIQPTNTQDIDVAIKLGKSIEFVEDIDVNADNNIHTHLVGHPITIDGKGQSIISKAESAEDFQWEGNIPAMSTIFSSSNGAQITVNNLSFEGTMSALMLGHYVDNMSNWYKTELNSVNVINTKVVSFSQNISPAVCIYGNAELNNCNIHGTTLSDLDTDPKWPVYDVAAVNYSKTTVNGGYIGSFFFWNQAALIVKNGTTIDTLKLRGNMNNNNNNNYIEIKSGAKINILDLTNITDKGKVKINIEDGAIIGKVVANGLEYATLSDYLK